MFKLNLRALAAAPSWWWARDYLVVANILQHVVAAGDGPVPTFAFVAELTSWVRI